MRPPEPAASVRRWAVLTSVLAVGYLVVGMSSPLASVRWPTMAAGLLVIVAVWLPARWRAAAWTLLVVGAAVPAALAWWSLVLPACGILIVVLGATAIRHRKPGRAPGPSDPVDRVRPAVSTRTGAPR